MLLRFLTKTLSIQCRLARFNARLVALVLRDKTTPRRFVLTADELIFNPDIPHDYRDRQHLEQCWNSREIF